MKRKMRILAITGIAAAGLALAYPGPGGSALAHSGDGPGTGRSGSGWSGHRGSGHHGYGPGMSGYRGYGHQMGPRARFRSARYRRGGFRRHRPRAQKPIISLSLRFRDELKLNEEQIDKLENLRSDFIRRMIGERAALRTLRFDIRQALRADKVDVSAAEKLVRGAAKKRADIALDRIRTIEKGKALLTEEQFKELKTLTSRRGRGRWGGRDRYGAMMREHHDEMEREHHGDSQQGPPGKSESGKGKSGKSGPGKGKKF